jgi:hypothetical protein
MTPRRIDASGLTIDPDPPRLDGRRGLSLAYKQVRHDSWLALAAVEIERFHIPPTLVSVTPTSWESWQGQWTGAIEALSSLNATREFWHVMATRQHPGADGAILRAGWVAVGRGAAAEEAGFEAERALEDLHTIQSTCLGFVTLRFAADPEALYDLVRLHSAPFARALRRRRWEPPIIVARPPGTVSARAPAGVLLPWPSHVGPWAPLVDALAARAMPSGFLVRVTTSVRPPDEAIRRAEEDVLSVSAQREAAMRSRVGEATPLDAVERLLSQAATERVRMLSSTVLAVDPILVSHEPIGEGLTSMAVAALTGGQHLPASAPHPESRDSLRLLPPPPVDAVDLARDALWQPLDVARLPELLVSRGEAAALIRTAEPPGDERSPLPCSRARLLPLRGVAGAGLILGSAEQHGALCDVSLAPSARFQHVYIVGQTGTGKSTLLLNMIGQDVARGHGVTVLDPHGSLVDQVLARIPAARADDVIVVDPANPERCVGLNPLDIRSEDPVQYVTTRDRVTDELIDTFDAIYDLRQTGGPMFEQYFRMYVTLVAGSTRPVDYTPILPMVPLAMAHTKLARALADRVQGDDPITRSTLEEAAKVGGDHAIKELVPWVTSKLNRFYAPTVARRILCQPRCLDFEDVINNHRVLLVQLNRARLGSEAGALIARQVVLRLTMAAVERGVSADAPAHFLYADEFHRFATEQFAELLAEARKFRLGLVLAHQYTSQLVRRGERQVLDGVLGNAGTAVVFRVGAGDAELLEGIMMPRVAAADITGLPDFVAYVRSVGELGNVPFTLRTRPEPGGAHGEGADIRARATERYGVARDAVDKEIASALAAFQAIAR